jgi:hypothetical protein
MKYLHYLLFPFLLLPFTFLQAQNHGDDLRAETKLDRVYQQYSLSGQGVVVAMIERGIDYTHPDFIDDSGKTRIAYIYDMIDQRGANAPDNPYGLGTIYDRAQIDQALASNMPLGSTDRHGHGTACTGIACGDGSAMPGAPYRGVAPAATIIAVKVMHDFFPPVGNISGQQGYYNPSYLPVALEFVKHKTTELGLPSVSLINLGSIGGPTDGTSKIARAMRDFTDNGRLLVCGVGDDGGGDNRAQGSLTQGNSLELEIDKNTDGNLRLEVWYDDEDRFDVSIIRPDNSVEGVFPSPATNQVGANRAMTGILYYHRGSDIDFDEADNRQRQILIHFFGVTGTYKVRLTGATISDGTFTATLNPATYSTGNAFKNYVVPEGSICDFASAEDIIVPTSYVLNNRWTDINGLARQRVGEGNPGEIWVGSSVGPTRDGRIGVDVAAPGEVNIGAYSPDTYYGSFDHLQIENSNGLYGIQNAVSGAAPVVTGTLALMLEVNPSLSPQQAKSIVQQTARSDSFTSAVPNNTWGHGKLDALEAVRDTFTTVSNEPLLDYNIRIWPNPTTDWLNVLVEKPNSSLMLFTADGKTAATFSLKKGENSVNIQQLKPGVYFAKLRSHDSLSWRKVMKLR